ncbi:MAG: ABC transporter substrate-binding protein [Archaeoglobaceae archaeon]|nr:ABC transporter substrate-binding protein [Archaeoglobaceae archaeon]MCX8152733.1 ABC transporter substrate-binding protein [Archaeoglobaceae archaeon]MDW8013440.1 ABC transporter substrate-binding protein [Archaeoglobaceae archaeon]
MRKCLVISLVVILIFLSGCAADREVGKKEKTIVIGTTMPIKAENIFADYYFGILRDLMMDRLVSIGEGGKIYPELAESWEVTESGKVWIFKLRKNATFHDGSKLTAEDVAFTINYLREKIPEYRAHLALVEKAEAVDERTVKITLSKPWSNFLWNLAVMNVLPKRVWEKVDKPLEFFDLNATLGNGPFIFEKFDKASGLLVFKANANYWKGKPNVDRLIFRVFGNDQAMLMALLKGEIDTIYFYARGIDPAIVPGLLGKENISFIIVENLGVDNALWFNCKRYPFNITEFRVAISYALSYEDYVKYISAGYAEVPNAGFVPKGWGFYKETKKLEKNLTKASSILDSLGFKDCDKDGWRDYPNCTALEIRLAYRTDIVESSRLAEFVKSDLEKVGLRIRLQPLDIASFRQVLDRDKTHEIVISRTTMWGMGMWAGYGTGYFDARNIGWAVVSDAEFFEVVDALLNETKEENRQKLVHKLQDLYAEKLYAIPLYWGKIVQPYRSDKVESLVYNPMMGIIGDETWFKVQVKK